MLYLLKQLNKKEIKQISPYLRCLELNESLIHVLSSYPCIQDVFHSFDINLEMLNYHLELWQWICSNTKKRKQ